MKRIIAIIIAIVIGCQVSTGQKRTKQVTLIEMDLGFGLAYPLSNTVYYKNALTGNNLTIKPSFYYEWEFRVNLPGLPHSIGAQYALADFHKEMGELCDHISLLNLTVFYDYNFKQGKWINPFVGLGIGYANVAHYLADMNQSIQSIYWVPLDEKLYGSVCITPRIGVELFKHLRLTLAGTYIDKHASFFGFTVGGVFGGGIRTENWTGRKSI